MCKRSDHWLTARTAISLSSFLVISLACAGGDRPRQDTATAEAPAAVPPTARPPAAAGPITRQMVALGDSIFESKAAGGICYTCHGAEAKGTQLGPDVTDQQWLNGDGSYEFIVQTITSGVLTPKQFPGPMPPFGQMLSPDQVRAVSAYVYSLTHPVAGA